MKTIAFSPGEHIDAYAAALVAAAPAQGEFNGVMLKADGTQTAEEIVAAFHAELEARSAAYEASPEGISARERSAAELRALQDKADALVAALPSLDWSDDVAVLDWCCALQEPSDRIGMKLDRAAVIEAFRQHGFEAGANCGPDFRKDDRDNSHRWLVGQAMSGLQGPAIHHVIHKFAAEWKTRFGVAA